MEENRKFRREQPPSAWLITSGIIGAVSLFSVLVSVHHWHMCKPAELAFSWFVAFVGASLLLGSVSSAAFKSAGWSFTGAAAICSFFFVYGIRHPELLQQQACDRVELSSLMRFNEGTAPNGIGNRHWISTRNDEFPPGGSGFQREKPSSFGYVFSEKPQSDEAEVLKELFMCTTPNGRTFPSTDPKCDGGGSQMRIKAFVFRPEEPPPARSEQLRPLYLCTNDTNKFDVYADLSQCPGGRILGYVFDAPTIVNAPDPGQPW